jgi:hypothetical protein
MEFVRIMQGMEQKTLQILEGNIDRRETSLF